jgi:hypothetical protein
MNAPYYHDSTQLDAAARSSYPQSVVYSTVPPPPPYTAMSSATDPSHLLPIPDRSSYASSYHFTSSTGPYSARGSALAVSQSSTIPNYHWSGVSAAEERPPLPRLPTSATRTSAEDVGLTPLVAVAPPPDTVGSTRSERELQPIHRPAVYYQGTLIPPDVAAEYHPAAQLSQMQPILSSESTVWGWDERTGAGPSIGPIRTFEEPSSTWTPYDSTWYGNADRTSIHPGSSKTVAYPAATAAADASEARYYPSIDASGQYGSQQEFAARSSSWPSNNYWNQVPQALLAPAEPPLVAPMAIPPLLDYPPPVVTRAPPIPPISTGWPTDPQHHVSDFSLRISRPTESTLQGAIDIVPVISPVQSRTLFDHFGRYVALMTVQKARILKIRGPMIPMPRVVPSVRMNSRTLRQERHPIQRLIPGATRPSHTISAE